MSNFELATKNDLIGDLYTLYLCDMHSVPFITKRYKMVEADSPGVVCAKLGCSVQSVYTVHIKQVSDEDTMRQRADDNVG